VHNVEERKYSDCINSFVGYIAPNEKVKGLLNRYLPICFNIAKIIYKILRIRHGLSERAKHI